MAAVLTALGVTMSTAAGEDPLASMVNAEHEFARAAATRGIRAAFIEFLDDEAVGFGPTLGNAKEQWRSREEPANPLATSLAWDPRTGGVSDDGRLGWLTGPYVLVPNGDVSKTRYGCYFSVWRRTHDGPWRVWMDLGISTPQPCNAPAEFEPYPGRAAGTPGHRDDLATADSRLNRAIGDRGAAAAFGPVMDERVRMHREGQQPIVGVGAAKGFLSGAGRAWTFTAAAAAVAASGDLGITYGRAEPRRAADAPPWYYVRVWRRAPEAAWRIVFDTVSSGG